MSADHQVFMGRQPILDRHQLIVGYELLFRGSADAAQALIDDARAAACRVIVDTFTTLGADHVLGDRLGFFNVTRELLDSGVLEALPADRVVIEVLETVDVNADLVERCRELRDAGFRLALDDYAPDDQRDDLMELVDLVKVDLPAVPKAELPGLVRRLRAGKKTLLAEKVETEEEFNRCLELGFDLFQGYFFAHPTTLTGTKLDSGQAALVALVAKLGADGDVEEIIDVFSRHANLGLSLMRLVNSSAMGPPVVLGSIADAVNYLGRRQLQRWATIALYAGGEKGLLSPLLPTAARRGRLMELVMNEAFEGAPRIEGDRAFLAGMLSLVDVLLGQALEEVVAGLHLEPSVTDALLKRDGTLGTLLGLSEAVEVLDSERVQSISSELGMPLDRLQALDLDAYRWVHDLSRDAS